MSLNLDPPEKPIQALQRKLPEDRKNLIKIIQHANNYGKSQLKFI